MVYENLPLTLQPRLLPFLAGRNDMPARLFDTLDSYKVMHSN